MWYYTYCTSTSSADVGVCAEFNIKINYNYTYVVLLRALRTTRYYYRLPRRFPFFFRLFTLPFFAFAIAANKRLYNGPCCVFPIST